MAIHPSMDFMLEMSLLTISCRNLYIFLFHHLLCGPTDLVEGFSISIANYLNKEKREKKKRKFWILDAPICIQYSEFSLNDCEWAGHEQKIVSNMKITKFNVLSSGINCMSNCQNNNNRCRYNIYKFIGWLRCVKN